MQIAGGKIALALEGGYCIPALEASISACTRVLLGHSLDPPNISLGPNQECVQTVEKVITILQPFWKCFADFTPTLLTGFF